MTRTDYTMHGAGACHHGCPFRRQNGTDEWCAHPKGPQSNERFYLPIHSAPEWCPRRGLTTVVPALEAS